MSGGETEEPRYVESSKADCDCGEAPRPGQQPALMTQWDPSRNLT